MEREDYDVAVVGAGILGLAHAYWLARRGLSVVVLERSRKAQGASVRNFGMIWPIGQPLGEMRKLALRSRELWREVIEQTGLWSDEVGSLHLARREDEAQVLEEIASRLADDPMQHELLSAEEVARRWPAVRRDGLLAGFFSEAEICIDPREAMATLPSWLEAEYGVRFQFGSAVTGFDAGEVRVGDRRMGVRHLLVCSGIDLQTLYPEQLATAGIRLCKLQMLRGRAEIDGRLGVMLAGGLTLAHYASFRGCPTLPELEARLRREFPVCARYGIHVLASQNGRGELLLGDSHEYGDDIEIFDKCEIDEAVLDYLGEMVQLPRLRITERWHGLYGKCSDSPWWIGSPKSDVTIVTGIGGAGMTLSFGLAERVVTERFGNVGVG
ncbi:MAG: TIGR03364 family FAD-dependent oxidoreductase [Planctomycetota bacterium]